VSLLFELLQVLFLAAPLVLAGMAHMVLVKLDLLASLKRPLDGGRCWRGARIFGENKTWRGVLLMMGLTLAFMLLQDLLVAHSAAFRSLALYDYSAVSPWLAGLALGLGYVLAELPNSFIKRRLGIRSGRSTRGWLGWLFMVIDQGDSVLGCLLAMYVYWTPSLRIFMLTLLTGTGLHLAVNGVLVLAGLKGSGEDDEAAANPPVPAREEP